MKKSYHPDRCGDLGIVIKPYYLFDDKEYVSGTSHGSPHSYDTHVPLFVFGPGVKPGQRTDDVAPQAVAAIFAQALGIRPPEAAEYAVPSDLLK